MMKISIKKLSVNWSVDVTQIASFFFSGSIVEILYVPRMHVSENKTCWNNSCLVRFVGDSLHA